MRLYYAAEEAMNYIRELLLQLRESDEQIARLKGVLRRIRDQPDKEMTPPDRIAREALGDDQ